MKDKAYVRFVLDNNRMAAKVYALIASESRMNLAYDLRFPLNHLLKRLNS